MKNGGTKTSMTGESNEQRTPCCSTLETGVIPISSPSSSPCLRVSVVEFLRLSFTDVGTQAQPSSELRANSAQFAQGIVSPL